MWVCSVVAMRWELAHLRQINNIKSGVGRILDTYLRPRCRDVTGREIHSPNSLRGPAV